MDMSETSAFAWMEMGGCPPWWSSTWTPSKKRAQEKAWPQESASSCLESNRCVEKGLRPAIAVHVTTWSCSRIPPGRVWTPAWTSGGATRSAIGPTSRLTRSAMEAQALPTTPRLRHRRLRLRRLRLRLRLRLCRRPRRRLKLRGMMWSRTCQVVTEPRRRAESGCDRSRMATQRTRWTGGQLRTLRVQAQCPWPPTPRLRRLRLRLPSRSHPARSTLSRRSRAWPAGTGATRWTGGQLRTEPGCRRKAGCERCRMATQRIRTPHAGAALRVAWKMSCCRAIWRTG